MAKPSEKMMGSNLMDKPGFDQNEDCEKNRLDQPLPWWPSLTEGLTQMANENKA